MRRIHAWAIELWPRCRHGRPMTPRSEQLGFLLAAGLCGAALWLLVARTIVPGMGRMTHGYPGYHTASYLLVHGEWGPQAYDNDWYAAKVQRLLNQPISEIITPNLPTVTLLALPLAGAAPQTARDIWVWGNLPLLLGALALLARGSRDAPARPAIWLGFAAIGLALPATRANFRIGQAYIVLLLLFALAFHGLKRGRDWQAGLALGLAFMLKASGLPIWLLFIWQRRWRGLAAGLLTCALLVVATLPWIGLASWIAYPAALARSTSGPAEAVTAYQNIFSWLTHLLRRDSEWNPAPLADWPGAIRPLFGLIAGASIGITLHRSRRAPPELAAGALLILSVVLLPLAEEHQFTLLLAPLAVWLHDWVARSTAGDSSVGDSRAGDPQVGARAGQWLLPLLALALLLLPSYYKDPAWSVGWRALAAYPRLYGGTLLWLALIGRMRQAERHPGRAQATAWRQ